MSNTTQLKTVLTDASSGEERIVMDFFGADTCASLCVFVSGSGGTGAEWIPIIRLIQPRLSDFDFCSFSFRGRQTDQHYPLSQQVVDLQDVLTHLTQQKQYSSIVLVATSMGTFSTVRVATDEKYQQHISHAVLIDPADYYLADENKMANVHTWSGFMDYAPDRPTVSGELTKLNSNMKVDVIHLTIRNHGPDGYPAPEQRSEDDPRLFPRLNGDMVKSFYLHTPEKNHGRYREIANLPHAFLRDGDADRNQRTLADLVIKLLATNYIV